MKKIKLTIDILMLVAMPLLMAYSLIGEQFHEVLGAAAGCLFIVHNILNRAFYKNIFRGKYNATRILFLVVDIALLIDVLLLMASGIILSTFVFAFVEVDSLYNVARLTHLCAAYWGFVLMSFHAGMHIRTPRHHELVSGSANEMPKQVRHDNSAARNDKTRQGRGMKIILIAFAILICGFGIYSFIKNNFFDYMFLRTHFAFLDFELPRVLFFAQYLSIMALFATAGVLVVKLIRR